MGSDPGRSHLRRTLAALVLGAACLPAAAQTLPGLRPGARTPADLDRMPFRALVRVQTELGARCTGFMIAPAVAMTAAHCLYLPRVGRDVQPASVHVLLGYAAGRYRAHARVTRFVVAQGYDPRREAQTLGHDRAVLVLDRPVTSAHDTLPPAPPPAAGETLPVRVAGWDIDRAEIALAAPPCTASPLPRDATGAVVLHHDCSVTHGASGAPLVASRNGRDVAIGLVVGGDAGGNLAAALE